MIGIRSEGKVAEVDQLIDNMNAGETDAFLAAFAPDGYVDDNGAASTGRDEIRVRSDRELIDANTKMEITGSESTADTVAVDIEVTSSGFNGYSRFVFATDNGMVRSMTIAA